MSHAPRFMAALLALLMFAVAAQAVERSSKHRAAFQRANPCPANGKKRGPCPGYVVDHIKPLCAGGPDEPANMQWQTVKDAREKDREEWRTCRAMRRRQ